MIKDNQQHFNRLHVVIDAIIIALAYVLAWSVQFQLLNRESGYVFRHYMSMLPFLIPLYLVLYAVFGLYTTKSVRRKRVEVEKIVQANAVGIVLFMTAMFFFRQDTEFTTNFSRMLLAWFYPDQCHVGMPVPQFYPSGPAAYPGKGLQPEAYDSGGLQPGGGGIHRPHQGQS